MANPTVEWRADGTPYSPRFGDIYRSTSGLAQAQAVFLEGCGLLRGPVGSPMAVARPLWAHAPRWAVLEAGFGLGLNFLATWLAWQSDPERPQRLFYSAVEAFPPDATDLLRSAAPYPALRPLAEALAAQWRGLLPGLHRLSLNQGRVQLTLAVGDVRAMLAELSGAFDSVYLDGFEPERNPDMWGLPVIKAIARLARPDARAATWCVAAPVREALITCGFEVERVRGPAPKGEVLRARLAPRWSPRRRQAPDAPVQVAAPGHCVVIGGGLAGASAAYSLTQRGWRVTVLDAAPTPATGASGLPAGVVAPHVSPDDRPLSRLTRAGARATLARAAALLQEGVDFGATGVLERHSPGERRPPAAWQDVAADGATAPESWPDTDPRTRAHAQAAHVPLDDTQRALWHEHAGWIRPAALVRAMLGAPGVAWQGGQAVASLRPHGAQWQVLGADRTVLAEADLVFVTAGFGSLALLPARGNAALPLHALRGQVAWGPMPDDAASLPPFPVSGHGSLIAHVPGNGGPMWVTGSTFERGESQPLLRPEDHAHNRQRLAELLPAASATLDAQWPDGRAQAWAGVRATLPDRLPAVGAWPVSMVPDYEKNRPPAVQPPAQAAIETAARDTPLPLHVLTGLGARGLTLAVLCGEIAAAWLHGEPLPVEASLARKLRAGRFGGTPAG
ncbi:FAD-dependent 5-carboxymethylaminomethyl-2-thiouridine(34) oxidoreductase MnmC [Ottowia sp. GY511]|uniref:tRNA 5-methylaminomethyl-2-thiouridine biosynthesis bifunctional protein MnmC n=1 Tax=Ottowia flava TaxID=2675430 RepID=A0ABW4KWY1_9BURK|nr:FAD-dependent 5-carboxymethylaminomethyl-2-thiouridine(34) oxidoreductase MnmC [Ottowia sp. GY511]TXK24956.1 FAD-dependent 5-carboxymethylaminomethyl-2-thiouridine(34) oxidoreductase MnmC [Ottowia sp. GY511]